MGVFEDLTGKQFGYLTVLNKSEKRNASGHVYWNCKCICGNEKLISSARLKQGTETCGCRYKDLRGLKSGNLTAIKYVGLYNNNSMWLCKCKCGNEIEVKSTRLRNKTIKSCGCGKGRKSHGMANTRIYNIWCAMKRRCDNKTNEDYYLYGGRGITYDSSWSLFENFYKDMGDSYLIHLEKYGKENTTLDRIDCNGNYDKHNCRWATVKDQSYNKRGTIYVEDNGQMLTIPEISKKYNLPLTTLYTRYEKGDRGERLFRPKRCSSNINKNKNSIG